MFNRFDVRIFFGLLIPAYGMGVQVGQTEAQVLKELGEPAMKVSLGTKGESWAYKHGSLIMRSGRVVSSDFRSKEQVELVEREERDARAKLEAEKKAEQAARARAAQSSARISALDNRYQSFHQYRHAVLFNPMISTDQANPGTIKVESVAFTFYRTEEQFVETGSGGGFGDSRQSVGGGGGVGLSGRAGYVIPSVDHVVLWVVIDAGDSVAQPLGDLRLVFTNQLDIQPSTFRVSLTKIPPRQGDAPGVTRYRSLLRIGADSLPAEVFARSDGVSLHPGGEQVSGAFCRLNWRASAMAPVVSR